MIGRDFSDFDAMIFNRCNSIHTMLMKINLDVIFVDSRNRVCDLREKLLPWRPLVRCAAATAVIELPEGAIRESDTAVGDVLDLNAEMTKDTAKEAGSAITSAPELAMVPTEGQGEQ